MEQQEIQFEKIAFPQGSSITYFNFHYRYFPRPWHYHPEMELLLITAGHGKRFVGDSVEDFVAGDLVLTGGGLPHYYMSDREYYQPQADLRCASETLQFSPQLFPAGMLALEEMASLRKLIEESCYGVKFTVPPHSRAVQRMMRHVGGLQGVARVAALMRLLDLLARNYPYRMLASHHYTATIPRHLSGDVSGNLRRWITENFRESISVTGLAARMGMNPSAMCRSFLRETGKTILGLLTETRISFSCKLLSNTSMSISQIAFDSGFHTISHFNHCFRKMHQMTPSQYRRLHRG